MLTKRGYDTVEFIFSCDTIQKFSKDVCFIVHFNHKTHLFSKSLANVLILWFSTKRHPQVFLGKLSNNLKNLKMVNQLIKQVVAYKRD